MPRRALTNRDLHSIATKAGVPYFRGVCMRNELDNEKPWKNESRIINLDDREGPGSHWVTYKKRGPIVHYFDGFGNLGPPKELVDYLGPNTKIFYNYDRYQRFNSYNCGQLCIRFLLNK